MADGDAPGIDDEVLELVATDGGAADHVRLALIRRAAQAQGREPADPEPTAHGGDAAARPPRRRDLFSMPDER